MTRREVATIVFNFIKNCGFTPYDIEYGNCYFIFDKGEDGVCHFRIKGMKHWKFAMWIDTDEENLKNENGKDYPALQFFCQHNLNIDKFKPSRSFHLVEVSYNQLCEIHENDWCLYDIKRILNMIKRHPIIAFTMDALGCEYYNESYIKYYLKTWFNEYKHKLCHWSKDAFTKLWHNPKVWFIKRYKVVDSVEFIDGNGDGWVCYPRYDMRIHFNNMFDEEKQDNKESKIISFWFRKKYYKNMNINLTRDGIEGTYCYR